mmetsp:Transcript_6020/g.12394  ORF Transcript_6020/g.12394 Transcript_6020/m.12394 type:complete len:290 (-) Transcript_6020:68-937(-)
MALVEAIQNSVGIVRIPRTPARLDLAGKISLKAHAVKDTGRLVVLVVNGGSNNIVLFFRQIIVVSEFGIRKGITVGLPVDAFRRKRLVESKPAQSRGRSAGVACRALEFGNRRGAKATRLGSSHGIRLLLVAHLFVGHGQNLDGFGSGGRRNGRATGSSFHGWGGRNSSSVGVLGNQIVGIVRAALGERIRAVGFFKTKLAWGSSRDTSGDLFLLFRRLIQIIVGAIRAHHLWARLFFCFVLLPARTEVARRSSSIVVVRSKGGWGRSASGKGTGWRCRWGFVTHGGCF